MTITREEFDQQRQPRFGTANPERMHMTFWEWMIRSGPGAANARRRFAILNSREGSEEDGPVWTFVRFGASRTKLADGRVICVGGEHEDHYDADFNIFNDVVLFTPDNQVEIYGYPREIFPPTDFHTATLLGEQLILIGCLGYPDERQPGRTPVYSLNLTDYRITELPTSGETPGWIYEHQAQLNQECQILIKGGMVAVQGNDRILLRYYTEEHILDVNSETWRQVTQRNWRQMRIEPADQKGFDVRPRFVLDARLPIRAEHTILPNDERGDHIRILVDETSISILNDHDNLTLIVEGALPSGLVAQIAEDLRIHAQAFQADECIVEEV